MGGGGGGGVGGGLFFFFPFFFDFDLKIFFEPDFLLLDSIKENKVKSRNKI
jgi:hypothetical protein